METTIAILGASGYVGAELLRLCAGHPALRPTRLYADRSAGGSVAELYPHLAPAYGEANFEALGALDLDGVDLVMAALPHGESQRIIDPILAAGLPFIDLGADFRLADAGAYRQWYGEDHRRPELLGRFVLGLPEVSRERLGDARLVAAPGCYATAAILALKPLVDLGLVESTGLIVDAASGLSGAGRAAAPRTAFCEIDESFAAYELLSHRHTGEMEAALGAKVLFTPHLAPMNRGILATCHGRARHDLKADEPLQALRQAYAEDPFVHVVQAPPATKWALGSNSAFVTARHDPRTGQVVAICALDNLVKGAAGQMIQCANLMLGLDERSGLPACGLFP